jgi:Flp pilus assembly protein TadD
VRRPGTGRYLGVVGVFAAGLMAKPMLVTLPFVLLLLDVWPLGRLGATRGVGEPSGAAWSLDVRAASRLVIEKLPMFALTVASSIVTYIVQERSGAVGTLDAFPLGQRVANAVVTYVAYIGKMFWPAGLAVIYPYPETLPAWWVIGGALALLGVTAVVVWGSRRRPYLAVGWFWYVGTLVPVIGLVQVGLQSMAADRYTYVPLIGLFVMLAWGIPDLVARWPEGRRAMPVVTGLAIAACVVVATLQVRHWRDSEALWTRAVEVTHDNHRAHNDLGNILGAQGRVDEAVAHYTEALRIKPDFVEAYINLGNLRATQGRVDEAIARYADALRIRPGFAAAHNNLGFMLATQGRADEAIAHYEAALRASPDFVEAHRNLGIALAAQGSVDQAMREFREAVRIKPDDAEAHYRLGLLLADQGKVEEAARHFETASRLDPRFQRIRRTSRAAAGPGLDTR